MRSRASQLSDDAPPLPVRVVYSPPSPEVIEAFARQVCQHLGGECLDHEIVNGLATFIKIVGAIQANHLNRQSASEGS